MTYTEVEKKIEEFKASEEFKLLTKPNFLQIAGKSRSETAFTSLFTWVLSNLNFNDLEVAPLKRFLQLISKNATDQEGCGGSLVDSELKEMLKKEDTQIRLINLQTEVPSYNTNGSYNGRVDLVMALSIIRGLREYNIGIILENKIDAGEHQKQCAKYYKYFTRYKKIKINEAKYKVDSKIFVYSCIENRKDSLSSDKYVVITHQDIYDWILRPLNTAILSKENIQENKRFLEEYISALTSIKTNRKGQIAMDEKTKKLLGKLYKSHQDIIDAMIRFGSNDPDSVRAVENKIKSDSTKFQILYYKGQKKVIKETNQTHLLSDLIKLHMQYDDATREDIEKLFEGEK